MLRTGIDLIEIPRFSGAVERHGERLLQRVFTPAELADCHGHRASLAARYAAKEAVSKALGTGIGPVAWREIEILRGPAREPVLYLHGAAAQKSSALGLREWSVSLSHLGELAVAMAVAIGSDAS